MIISYTALFLSVWLLFADAWMRESGLSPERASTVNARSAQSQCFGVNVNSPLKGILWEGRDRIAEKYHIFPKRQPVDRICVNISESQGRIRLFPTRKNWLCHWHSLFYFLRCFISLFRLMALYKLSFHYYIAGLDYAVSKLSCKNCWIILKRSA